MSDPQTPDQLRARYRRAQFDPVQEGHWFEQVLNDWGMSEAQLALLLDKPRAYIQQRRRLVRASRAVQVAVRRELISFSQARGIMAASDDRNRQRRAVHVIVMQIRAGGRPSERLCRAIAETM